MNIGIVVHSQTGNTHLVAMKLSDKLLTEGHTVDLVRLEVVGEGKDLKIGQVPDLAPYDALVFGAPVQAFSLSQAMQQYLQLVKKAKADRVALLVTQHFPYTWMGGSRAVGQLRKLLEAKGFKVSTSAIVNWSRKDRDNQIIAAVDKVALGIIK